MNINPKSPLPIYQQIAEGVREAVAAGIYEPGDPLPSLRAMALKVKVNPNTVQRAYDELAREGLIYSQRGKGLFVAEQAAEDALKRARQSVRQFFEEGIRAGRSAGLQEDDLQELFKACLKSKVASGEKQS
ncbi:MAG: GntR family transcriptional regulator [Planctomycetaceae bacterium]|nr:GntR family transcriptional regulator [Planctomycetaceae bacterium]